MGNAYPKVLACIDTEQELVRRVRSWIDLKYQTYFYTCNNGDLSKQLSRSTALFLANYVLAKYVEFEIYDESKQDMLQLCREHYSRNQLELNNIKEFELTYTASDAIMWYTRASFVYKMINRALRTFDEIKLRTMAFFIRDLRQQLKNYYQTAEINAVLNEFHSIFYISPTLPSNMHNNPRIRFYPANLLPKAQDTMGSMEKTIEKLTGKLRHDLAKLYRQEAERALNEQDDRITSKQLFAKSAKSTLADTYLTLHFSRIGGPTRLPLAKAFTKLSDGKHLNYDFVECMPIRAFRIVLSETNGNMTIDGEKVPYGSIQGQVLPSVARCMGKQPKND
ncbi:unnamed protein product [Rotaria sp. Silwood1]|nr:unnamed protein product [Rotaria sp. Silwood1]